MIVKDFFGMLTQRIYEKLSMQQNDTNKDKILVQRPFL